MLPAHERLDAKDRARTQIHDRLVQDAKLQVFDGMLEVCAQRHAVEHGDVHRGLEA